MKCTPKGSGFVWIVFWLTMAVGIPMASANEGLLDSLVFVGQFEEKHISGAESDKLVFDNGTFHSDAHARQGFAKGAYSAEAEQDKIYFQAVTTSPSNGTITWSGVVSGDTIEVNFRLRKDGWFADTVKDYMFRGTLAK